PIAFESAFAVKPSGFKNSSLRISPGGTGRIPFFFIFLLLNDRPISKFYGLRKTFSLPTRTLQSSIRPESFCSGKPAVIACWLLREFTLYANLFSVRPSLFSYRCAQVRQLTPPRRRSS